MKKLLAVILINIFLLTIVCLTFAGEQGTKAEAEAMVTKAIAYIKEVGKDNALAEFSKPKGKFVDRDLYIFVYDMNGKVLAHGANQKMIGKDLIEMQDPDGKYYVKERIGIAKTKGKGWQDYKFPNPTTKKIEPKTAYIEKLDDMIIGCGVYNQ